MWSFLCSKEQSNFATNLAHIDTSLLEKVLGLVMDTCSLIYPVPTECITTLTLKCRCLRSKLIDLRKFATSIHIPDVL